MLIIQKDIYKNMVNEMNMVSVIIVARNEIYLQKTIESVLAAAEGEIEIIVVLDGYWPDPPMFDNKRVILIHHTESIGQRQAINKAARIARGKFIFKLDAHCAVDQGFDVKLAADCEYDWTVIPRMRNLDIETWRPRFENDERMAMRRGKINDYMYIGFNEKGEFRTLYYTGKNYWKWHRRPDMIDDTMSCMGPGWFMHKDRFWELGGCDENHGGWGQQGVEVALKAWLSGGSLKVNKKTWFAHWFRGGGGPGFPYPLPSEAVDSARAYSRDLWLNNKWSGQKRPFEWIIKKFNPPGWENYMFKKNTLPENQEVKEKINELNRTFYRHIHIMRHEPLWKGVRVIKMPSDLVLYHQVIWQNKPDFIIDCGTKYGGSALFFADMLDLVGAGGKVISIDKYPVEKIKDLRVIYLEGGSTSDEILAKVREIVGAGSVMAVLDSDHRRPHVKRELIKYAPIVTKGQFMVVEDCYDSQARLAGPGEAKDWFLKINKEFEQTAIDKQFLIGYCRDGWLQKL